MAKFGRIFKFNQFGLVAGLCFELDGGCALAVYLNPAQHVSGGDASAIHDSSEVIDPGKAA